MLSSKDNSNNTSPQTTPHLGATKNIAANNNSNSGPVSSNGSTASTRGLLPARIPMVPHSDSAATSPSAHHHNNTSVIHRFDAAGGMIPHDDDDSHLMHQQHQSTQQGGGSGGTITKDAGTMGLREASHVSMEGTAMAHESQPLCQCEACQALINNHTNYAMLDSYMSQHLPWEKERAAALGEQGLFNVSSQSATIRTNEFMAALQRLQEAASGSSSNSSSSAPSPPPPFPIFDPHTGQLTRDAIAHCNAAAAAYADQHNLFPVFFFNHLHTMKNMTDKTRNFSLNMYQRERNERVLADREAVRRGAPLMDVDPQDIVSTRQMSRRGHADKPQRQLDRIQHQMSGGTPPLGPSGSSHQQHQHGFEPLPPAIPAPHSSAGTNNNSSGTNSHSASRSRGNSTGSSGAHGFNNMSNNNSFSTHLGTPPLHPANHQHHQHQQQQQQQQQHSGNTPGRSPVTREGRGGGFVPTGSPFPASAPPAPYPLPPHQHQFHQQMSRQQQMAMLFSPQQFQQPQQQQQQQQQQFQQQMPPAYGNNTNNGWGAQW